MVINLVGKLIRIYILDIGGVGFEEVRSCQEVVDEILVFFRIVKQIELEILISIFEDGDVKLEVMFNGILDEEWIKDGIVIQESNYFQINLEVGVQNFVIKGVIQEDNGVYKCMFFNKVGFLWKIFLVDCKEVENVYLE